jgi:DNA-binding MarR family transcriptional regulator
MASARKTTRPPKASAAPPCEHLASLGALALAARMKRISDAMVQEARGLYRQLDLDVEPNWYLVFLLLEDGSARSVGELATALGFAHPSVLALTGRMVERGLLDATGDPRDGRVTLLRLTARGVKALQQARPVWDASRRGIEGMLAEVGVDVLGALDALDAALARRGFAGRTLDELAATRPAAKTRKTEAKRR